MDDTAVMERRNQLRAELLERSIYELLGGETGLRAIVGCFYDLMQTEPAFTAIRSMHAPDLSPMRQGLFEFLSGWLGGPQLFVERTGSPCLTHAHAPFVIDGAARDQWMECMRRAMDAAEVPQRYSEALLPGLGSIADMLQNDRGPATP